MALYIKRIYELPSPEDGYRILVDRLWPRGIKKENAKIDEWLKEVAPSTDLRKWFNHEPEKWKAFQEKYAEELSASITYKKLQLLTAEHSSVTLIYAAKDEQHNQAAALQLILQSANQAATYVL